MLTEVIQSFIENFAIDAEIIAVLIQLTLGLGIAYMVGQVIAFNKFVQWRRPFLQVVGFIFGKTFNFLMATIKSLVVVLVAYFALLIGGAFIGEDIIVSQSIFIVGFYVLAIVVALAIGYTKERTKVLHKNLLAGESERLKKETMTPASPVPSPAEGSLDL